MWCLVLALACPLGSFRMGVLHQLAALSSSSSSSTLLPTTTSTHEPDEEILSDPDFIQAIKFLLR
jgi:hypothetical protein